MLAIARSTKLTTTSNLKVEDETCERVQSAAIGVETEFYGGEKIDEPENDDVCADSWRPMYEPSLERLTAILCRHSEVASPPKSSQPDPILITTITIPYSFMMIDWIFRRNT